MRGIFIVGLKLFSLYHVTFGVMLIPTLVSWIFFGNMRMVPHFLLPYLVQWFLSTAIIPAILWKNSERISRWVVKSDHVVVAKGCDFKSLQSVLFCAVGLSIFLQPLPNLIQEIAAYARFIFNQMPGYLSPPGLINSMFNSILQVLLGLTVMIMSRRLSNFVNHRVR